MFVNFGVIIVAITVLKSYSAGIGQSCQYRSRSRAGEFVHNQALRRFRGNIFYTQEGIGGGGIPWGDKFDCRLFD